MTNLEIILLIIIYILLSIVSYKRFKILNEKGWLDHSFIAALIFPIMWAMLVLIAIWYGFKHVNNNDLEL